MPIAVTLLMSSGDPDPHWTLTPEQEQEFLNRLAASPVPSVTVGPPGRRADTRGLWCAMARRALGGVPGLDPRRGQRARR